MIDVFNIYMKPFKLPALVQEFDFFCSLILGYMMGLKRYCLNEKYHGLLNVRISKFFNDKSTYPVFLLLLLLLLF